MGSKSSKPRHSQKQSNGVVLVETDKAKRNSRSQPKPVEKPAETKAQTEQKTVEGEAKAVGTTVLPTVTSSVVSSSSSSSTTSSLALPDTKRVLSSASSASYQTTLRAITTLDDYLKNATLKPTPGLLFKDVLPFQPLTLARLVHEDVDNLAQLAVRLRNLRRTLQYDFIQLTTPPASVAEAKDDKSAPPLPSGRRLSQSLPEVSDWVLFQPEDLEDKQRLAESLSRLGCDERLEVLAMVSELRQQLRVYESESTPWSAQPCYQAALLAHDRRQGWARLVPPAETADAKENKETKETKGITVATGETRVIPPAFVQLRDDLGGWLGVNQRPSLENVRTRLLAIQDYCQTAQRISECSVHLQHEIQLARRVVAEFKSNAFKDDPELIQAICQLAAAQDPELLRALLGTLIDSIKESSLLQVHVLQGLATVLTHSRAEDVGLGDLHTILGLLQGRTQEIGSDLSDADTLQLVQTLGSVLASMAVISQQRQLAEAARQAAKTVTSSVHEPLFSFPDVPLTLGKEGETTLGERMKFIIKAKTDTVKALISAPENKPEKNSAAILSADAYDALCKGLHEAVVGSVQKRYGDDLNTKNPELYFAVLLIRQALMRLAHKQAPAQLLQKAYQFFTILDKAKNAVSHFSVISLLQAGNQMADLIGSTAWGKKLGAHFAGEEARPQPWFEQFLILKTLIGSDQLRELETTLVQAGRESSALTLNYPLCIGTLQLLDSVVQSESRPDVRKAAMQLLQLLASDQPWQWPTTAEFAAVQQRLKEKCGKDYASDGRLTLDQRRQQTNYQRAQQHSQVALRTARRHCQESDIRFQLHDYCLLQTRQAQQDAQWLQDNGRYIPALAKPRFDVTDDNAQLFFPMFDAFRRAGRAGAETAVSPLPEVKEQKGSASLALVPATAVRNKAQSTLLILGDAGTGKSLFIRRNHLIHCERYISRQFDQDSENATALGNTSHPLSFHLYLNQSPVEKPLEHYLQQQGFTEDHIRQLKDQGQLLVHLDGYDEWSTQGQNPWVFSPKTLGSWVSSRCQVIVACRSQHIQGAKDYKDYFTPPRKDAAATANTRDTSALSEWIITCLDEGGVAQLTAYYVHDEQAQSRNPWPQQKYLQQFRDSGIQGLVRTPIILLMALQVLPTLQKRMPDNTQILRLDIYREFISQYLQTQRSKQLTRGTQHLTGVIEAAESYAQTLALALFNQEKAAVSYQLKARFSFAPQQDNPWHRFFADDSPDQLLSTIIPLRVNAQRNVQDGSTITQYSFTHKSMLDYFTALGLYAQIEELASQLEEAPPKAPTITFSVPDQSAMPLVQAAHAIPNVSLSLNLAVQWEAAQRYAKAKHEWQTRHQQRLIASPLSRRAVSTERSVVEFIDEILQDHSRRWEVEQAATTAQSSSPGMKESKETKESKESKSSKSQALSTRSTPATTHPREQFKARLTRIIQASRDYPELAQAAGNAATLLNACRYRFAGEVWHGVRIKGAYLVGSYWHQMDLNGATWEDCDLSASAWLGCDLRGVQFSRIRWGEFPSVQATGNIEAIAVNPVDVNQLAIASGNNILLYDRAQGVITHTLRGHEKEVTCLAYALGGAQLASASGDKTVRLWDPRGGEKQTPTTLRGHERYVRCLQYAPDSAQLASGSDDRTVRLWDPRGGEKQIPTTLRGHTDDVTRLAYAPGGGQLASGSQDSTVRLWDPRGGENQVSTTLRGHESYVRCLQYAPDGAQLASASGDKTVRLWDPRGGQKQVPTTLGGHEEEVRCLQYAPDGAQLASGSDDKTVRLWDPRGGQKQVPTTLGGHEGWVTCLAYAPGGGQLASGSQDSTVRLWDPRGGQKQVPTTLRGHEGWVSCLAYAPGGGQLASGSRDSTVRLWDPRGGEKQAPTTLRGHEGNIYCLAYAPGGGQLASGSEDNTVRLWDPQGGEAQTPTTLRGHEGNIYCLAYAPGGGQLASGSYDKSVRLWDSRGGEKQIPTTLRGHEGWVSCLAYAPGGGQLASGSEDNTVRLWDPQGGEAQTPTTLRGHTGDVTRLAYAPGGGQLASGSQDSTVRLWDPRGGESQTPTTLRGHESEVSCLQYAPDSAQLASGSYDKSVRLWDSRGGEKQIPTTLRGHEGWVSCLAYAPGGGQLASGSWDKIVRLWDPRGREDQTPTTLRGHEDAVTCLAYAPGGGQLASGSHDKTARLWDPRTGACLQLIPWVEDITVLCWGTIGAKRALFIGGASGTLAAFVPGPRGLRLAWVCNSRLPVLSFDGCQLSGAVLPSSEQQLLEQRGGSFKEAEVLESKAAPKALPQAADLSTLKLPAVESKQSGVSQGQGVPAGILSGAPASTLFGQSISSSVGASHTRTKAPVDAKAQRLLAELQATIDQLYPADKSEVALQRTARLAMLKPYSDRKASLTQFDRPALWVLKSELEDVQEALAISATPALTS